MTAIEEHIFGDEYPASIGETARTLTNSMHALSTMHPSARTEFFRLLLERQERIGKEAAYAHVASIPVGCDYKYCRARVDE